MNFVIRAGGSDALPIATEGGAIDLPRVQERKTLLTGRNIPNTCRVVLAGREHESTVLAESILFDGSLMGKKPNELGTFTQHGRNPDSMWFLAFCIALVHSERLCEKKQRPEQIA